MRTDETSSRGRTALPLALAALLTLTALLAVACGGGGGGGSAVPADVAAGHDLFLKTCATCHGKTAEGMPRLGKNLHANQFVNSQSVEQLVEFLKVGRPASHPDNTQGVDMPPRGGNPALTDDDLAKIVAYVRTLK